MPRQVAEWIGKTDNSSIPDRVKVRLFEKANGHCEICTRKLYPGEWEADHVEALANGGAHRESNLQAICSDPCHANKTREDVKTKALTYRKKKANLGLKKKSRFPGSKDSPWKQKIGGGWVRR